MFDLDLGRRTLEGLNVVVQAYRLGQSVRIGAERGEEEINAPRSAREEAPEFKIDETSDPYGEPKDDGLTESVHELFGDAVGQNVDVTPIIEDLFGDKTKKQKQEIEKLKREKQAAEEAAKKTAWTTVGIIGGLLAVVLLFLTARKR